MPLFINFYRVRSDVFQINASILSLLIMSLSVSTCLWFCSSFYHFFVKWRCLCAAFFLFLDWKMIPRWLLMSRAKYIVGTVKALQLKPGGGAEWLSSLRGLELHEVIDALCTLPGVGPKVAACIALFSLDQHHAIPVDTHVWKVCLFIFPC